MNSQVDKIINEIKESINENNFVDICYDLTDQLIKLDNAVDAVEPIINLIENNPNADFGISGPLVQFLEKFYKKGYEEKLVESIERNPTKYTVWMLNGVIADSKGEDRDYFLTVLENVMSHSKVNSEVFSFANHFRELQYCV